MRLARLTALAAAGALTVALTGTALAADPKPLQSVLGMHERTDFEDGAAQLRFLHGSPDAPRVDVYLDGTKVPELSADFGEVTGYIDLPSGAVSVSVCLAADETDCPIDGVNLVLQDRRPHTLTISDRLGQVKHHLFNDGAEFPSLDDAGLRVLHLSADTPALDILTVDGTTVDHWSDGPITEVVENLQYGANPIFVYLKMGEFNLRACLAGDASACPLTLLPVEFGDREMGTIYIIGSLSGSIDLPPTDTDAGRGGSLALLLLLLAAASLGLRVVARGARA